VLWPERQGAVEVGLEVGGALAGDPVDEIERDVVTSGIAKMVERASDGVWLGNTFEHREQMRTEALRAERDAVDAVLTEEHRERGRHRLGIRLDGHLLGPRQRDQQLRQRARLGE